MKKLITIIAAIIIGATAVAQSYETTYNRVGRWNEYTKEWSWGNINYNAITITLEDGVVKLSNVAGTILRFTTEPKEEMSTTTQGISYKSTYWYAIDQKKRRCMVVINRYYDDDIDNTFVIMYDDVALKYYFPKGLSKLNN